MRYRIAVAFLSGTGLSSLLSILLPFPILWSILLIPGPVLAGGSARPEDAHPVLVLAVNSFFYAGFTYTGLTLFGRGASTAKMRLISISLLLPVTTLSVLAFTPAFNPLWPHGFAELARHEQSLRDAFPEGITLNSARDVLRSRGIASYENAEVDGGMVFDDGRGTRIQASKGELVISARLETDAYVYPCGYYIEILLIFGTDERMRQQYIHRGRLCP
jgi:hypothetical protein